MGGKKRPTVADFFCGAGGFSEGFRQMGFEVRFALDNWKPAKETHDLNHPDCDCRLMDILELHSEEKINEIVPDTDVIVGSPPCVSFSGSNKAGKADKSLGIELIRTYLRVIAVKKQRGYLKYWILENVPNSGKYIKQRYTWKELGLKGNGPDLEIPNRNELNAAFYGAPQTRKRFVCGEYPNPETTNDETNWITVEQVMKQLSNPLEEPPAGSVKDPVHGFSLISSKLTDHYYDSRVDEFEWSKAKRLKEDHGFMGKMSFPEDIKRPSRTVMATMSASTRESMIFAATRNGKNIGYRLPTIREISCFMGFPINYQFQGSNEGTKYKLIGNAVCVPLSAALAKAILKDQKLPIQDYEKLPLRSPSVNLNGTKRRAKQPQPRRPDARFAVHVPGIKIRGFRVELDNLESDFAKSEIEWGCYLHYGSGKHAIKLKVGNAEIESILKQQGQFPIFKKMVETEFKKAISALELQRLYCQNDDAVGPFAILNKIRVLVDAHFPLREQDVFVDAEIQGLRIRKIPLRILAALYASNRFISQTHTPVAECQVN